MHSYSGIRSIERTLRVRMLLKGTVKERTLCFTTSPITADT